MMLRANAQIGPYTLIRSLGNGGFGVVWLAERRGALATTQVALKIPLDDRPDIPAIRQEAQLWAKANGHPNVLPVIEAEVYDGQIVIVSEYASDGSLAGWLKKNGGKAPSIKAAVVMLSGILAGLEHLHSRRIIHRDLKPANVLLQGEAPRLADFGLARVLKSSSHSHHMAGTPAYMPPEAFDGNRSERSDIWSAGVILYEMLVGYLPFPQGDMVALIGAILRSDPTPLPSSVPAHLRSVVVRALQKDPTKRYQSAAEMLAALQSSSHSPHPVNSVSRPVLTRRQLVLGGVIAGGGVWEAFTRYSSRNSAPRRFPLPPTHPRKAIARHSSQDSSKTGEMKGQPDSVELEIHRFQINHDYVLTLKLPKEWVVQDEAPLNLKHPPLLRQRIGDPGNDNLYVAIEVSKADVTHTLRQDWEALARGPHNYPWTDIDITDGLKLGPLDSSLLEFNSDTGGGKHHVMDYGAIYSEGGLGIGIKFVVPLDDVKTWQPILAQICSEFTCEKSSTNG